MTNTMTKLTKEILEEFDERFCEYESARGYIDVEISALKSFLQEVVKRAYEEGTKDAVKYIAERSESQVGEFTSLVNDITFKEALSELNKKEE